LTKEEYLNIGKKYLDLCQFNECFYMPGKAMWFNGAYQVAEFKSQQGYARIFYSCVVVDEGEIITGMKYRDVYEPSEFEDAIKKFQKSYKEALVKQKMMAIDEDFK
jgi:hypothetical protein